MTEEITTALGKVPDLRIVGRTSAFQFKGRNEDLRTIGRSLNAAHLIEGSVRKAGERVRVAAQLISADSGIRLWAETYDRQLTDIFQIQEDIARAIAAALRVPLGLSPGELLVPNRSIDLQAYDDYLRSGARMHMHPDEAIALLEAVVARDPRFAPRLGRSSVTPTTCRPICRPWFDPPSSAAAYQKQKRSSMRSRARRIQRRVRPSASIRVKREDMRHLRTWSSGAATGPAQSDYSTGP